MATTALSYIALAVMILVHLAGLVIGIILLAKKKGTPAILATVAFALLFLLDIGRAVNPFLIAALIRAVGQGTAETWTWANGGVGCCCGALDLAAIVCLIVALWQGLSNRVAPQAVRVEGLLAEVPPPQE